MANDNSRIPIFRDYTFRDVARAADPDIDKPADAYEFSNGRKFKDPEQNGGPYNQS